MASTFTILSAALLISMVISTTARAHGDTTSQAVDTKSLPQLGEQWRDENPYRNHPEAIRVGTSAYTQHCARCHGIDAISGGIASDLRKFDRDCVNLKNAAKKQACIKENDKYYLTSVRGGKVRNGAVYMPPYEAVFNQEAMWAIKAYLETRRETK